MDRRQFIHGLVMATGAVLVPSAHEGSTVAVFTGAPALSPPIGVPFPPIGYNYYLVEAKGQYAGRCIYCGKTLSHQYYTLDIHNGKGHTHQDDPHPPMLWLAKSSEVKILPGRAVLWSGQLTGENGFAYQSDSWKSFIFVEPA